MPEQNDNTQSTLDKGSEKSSGQASDTTAGQRDANLDAGSAGNEAPAPGAQQAGKEATAVAGNKEATPAGQGGKEASKPEAAAPVGKGAGVLDVAAAAAKGYASQTVENVKGALTSPASPIGGVIHGVEAAGHVVSAQDKVAAVKQEVTETVKNAHQALPGTAAREAGYAGLNDLSKGATVGQAATTAAEKALAHAPFAQTTDHVMKAEAANAKGDTKTAAEEVGKAGASFIGEVVQTALLVEGAAKGATEKAPAAAEGGGKGNTQPVTAPEGGGKGTTQPVTAPEGGGKGNTHPLGEGGGKGNTQPLGESPQSPMATTGAVEGGGKGNTQPLEAKSPQSPMATTGAVEGGGKGNTQPLEAKSPQSPMAQSVAPGGTPQVKIEAGGQPHAKTEVAQGAQGAESADPNRQDRPALTDHTAGNKTSELWEAKEQLEIEGKRYDAAGNETPEYQAAATAHEDALKEKLDGFSRNLQEYGRLRPF